MSLVELRRFANRVEGEIARTVLQSHGLYAALFDAESLGYADGWPVEVRLMVLNEERDEAASILKADGAA